MVVVAIALGLWGLNAWLDRQDWLPDTRAAKLMSTARLRCDPIWTTVASARANAWTDPAGNLYIASGPNREEDNAALNRCARANLGPGVPPVHWLKFVTIAALLLALSSIPLIAKPAAAGAPSRSRIHNAPKCGPDRTAPARMRPSGAVPSPADQPLAHDFGMSMAANATASAAARPRAGFWYCPNCRGPAITPRHSVRPRRCPGPQPSLSRWYEVDETALCGGDSADSLPGFRSSPGCSAAG